MNYTAAVITISDRASAGAYRDESGPAVCKLLDDAGYQIENTVIIPDEKYKIKEILISEADREISLIITTGGTGFAPRDITPEATLEVVEKECPGIAEYMRMRSMELTPRAMLSRGAAGIRNRSLIINLPGSPKGAAENLSFILPHLAHGLDMLNGMKD